MTRALLLLAALTVSFSALAQTHVRAPVVRAPAYRVAPPMVYAPALSPWDRTMLYLNTSRDDLAGAHD